MDLKWQFLLLSLNYLSVSKCQDEIRCCYKLGCFPNSYLSGFKHVRATPKCLDQQRPTFYFWTNVSTVKEIRFINHNHSLHKLDTDVLDRQLYVIIHGFGSKWPRSHLRALRIELLKKEFNVIMVDWTKGSVAPHYHQAVANSRVIAQGISIILNKLINDHGLNSTNIHLVGHSLGAHIAGFVGQRVSNINRIIGLDPAKSLFEDYGAITRLDPSDASFVQVIHTNGADLLKGGAGVFKPMGHIDFYANGGRWQPGCPTLGQAASKIFSFNRSEIRKAFSCSHNRAIAYFIESIKNSDMHGQCQFVAFPCNSTSKWLNGECFNNCQNNNCPVVGFNTDRHQRGIFYFGTRGERTRSVGGYCGIQTKVSMTSSSSVTGSIHIAVENRNITKTVDHFTFMGDDDELVRNVSKTVIYVAPWQMTSFDKVNVVYAKKYNWFDLLGSGKQKSWTLSGLEIVDQNNKRSFSRRSYFVHEEHTTVIRF